MILRVDQGKGQKDRYVMLLLRLLEDLRAYWKAERPERRPGCFRATFLGPRSLGMPSGRPATRPASPWASPSRSRRIPSGMPREARNGS